MGRGARKGDPPRGPPRGAGVFAALVPGRDDPGGLRGSGDGGDGRAGGSPSAPGRSSPGRSTPGPDRSGGRGQRGPGSGDNGPAGRGCSARPRTRVRPDDGTSHDTPEPPKTCDTPGRSSLCLEDRGSSTRGLGARTPGPHFVRGDGRRSRRPHAPDLCAPTASPEPGRQAGVDRWAGRRFAPKQGLRPCAGRSPLGRGPRGSERAIGARARLRRSAQLATRRSENVTFR